MDLKKKNQFGGCHLKRHALLCLQNKTYKRVKKTSPNFEMLEKSCGAPFKSNTLNVSLFNLKGYITDLTFFELSLQMLKFHHVFTQCSGV